MRDIKFRAWDIKLEMWVYGLDNFEFTDGSANLNLAAFFRRLLNGTFGVNTKGQFTGLQDKNGVDIYEGDIVSIEYNYLGKVKVEFLDGAYNVSKYAIAKCKVIGNIHEGYLTLNAIIISQNTEVMYE